MRGCVDEPFDGSTTSHHRRAPLAQDKRDEGREMMDDGRSEGHGTKMSKKSPKHGFPQNQSETKTNLRKITTKLFKTNPISSKMLSIWFTQIKLGFFKIIPKLY
jgi:hypothetical protein